MSIRISQMNDHSISVDQARYATSVVVKYLDTATVKARRGQAQYISYDIIIWYVFKIIYLS